MGSTQSTEGVQWGSVVYGRNADALPTNRPPGGLDLDLAHDAARLSSWIYFEMSSQWASTAVTDKHPHPVAPSHLSLNCLRTIGIFGDKMTNVLPYTLLDNSYDMDFDNGAGTVRNGIIVNLKSDTELAIVEHVDGEQLAIVWRGTESAQDWQTDINQWPVLWPYGGSSSENLRAPSGFVFCHESVAEPLFKTLRAVLKKKKYKKIVVCGHSLGGALAHLNTHALFHKLGDVIEQIDNDPAERLCCYTFGAPCPGTKAFSFDFAKHIKHCYRFVNDEDIVPRLSSFAFYTKLVGGLAHVGVEILMDEDEFIINPNDDRREKMTGQSFYTAEMMTDHTIDRYHELVAFHRIRLTKLKESDMDQIIKAWMTYVTGRKQKTPVFELQFPKTVKDDQDRDNIIANGKKVEIVPRYSFVPNDIGLCSELSIIAGREVKKEEMKILLLYARKCIFSHIFSPTAEHDDENITFIKFALSVWEFYLQPGVKLQAEARRVSEIRLLFDQVDLNKNGFISKEEFYLIFKDKLGSEFKFSNPDKPGQPDVVDKQFLQIYESVGITRDLTTFPITGLSFWECELWCALYNKDINDIKQAIQNGMMNIIKEDKEYLEKALAELKIVSA